MPNWSPTNPNPKPVATNAASCAAACCNLKDRCTMYNWCPLTPDPATGKAYACNATQRSLASRCYVGTPTAVTGHGAWVSGSKPAKTGKE